ncbi:Hypothetical predicted protein [Paramuricea clavata]|uniref:Uncharacterized protein n=1 Tax=Paramuricea clavata TaxID=317549 RepID=A0A7D9D927_PARCT|nr:Hypothetical predicted protein [Paramuricea clavata]
MASSCSISDCENCIHAKKLYTSALAILHNQDRQMVIITDDKIQQGNLTVKRGNTQNDVLIPIVPMVEEVVKERGKGKGKGKDKSMEIKKIEPATTSKENPIDIIEKQPLTSRKQPSKEKEPQSSPSQKNQAQSRKDRLKKQALVKLLRAYIMTNIIVLKK